MKNINLNKNELYVLRKIIKIEISYTDDQIAEYNKEDKFRKELENYKQVLESIETKIN